MTGCMTTGATFAALARGRGQGALGRVRSTRPRHAPGPLRQGLVPRIARMDVRLRARDDDDITLPKTAADEPDQYWKSKGEKQGDSPLMAPEAIIGIIGITFPFVFLLVAIGAGWIELP